MSNNENSGNDRSARIGRDANRSIIATGDGNVFHVVVGQESHDQPRQTDPHKYLRDLQANTSFIDIRGLQVGSGKATRFPIDELYIPLTTTDVERGGLLEGGIGEECREADGELQALAGHAPRRVELHEMLQHRRLVVVGDPGSGKTTFVRRIASLLCDLYESVIGWLSRARQREEGRLSPERCVGLLQKLALAMQNHPDGRQVQVTRHWAARAIAPQWRELPQDAQAEAAEKFLAKEELDSGIVVGRGDHVRFWHLTFQEFLAARGLAALAEDEQRTILRSDNHLYATQWKEVALLLAGVLYHQGIDRVDRFVSNVMDDLGRKPTLPDQALCVGLLGAAVHDLSPVGYQPRDERYRQMLDAVLGVFDAGWYDQPTVSRGLWSRIVGALSPKLSRATLVDVAIKAADSLGQAGDPRFSNANRANNWVTVGPGQLVMGESGQKIAVDAFQIGRYPVTVGEYRKFWEHECYTDEQWWAAGGFGEWTEPEGWEEQMVYPNRPVVGVSWYEAMAYAAWEGCRLPTEQQWEFAARGTEGRQYPWGNDQPDRSRSNYGRNIGHPTPVGVYPLGATPEGICDMAGNVWEWCDSVYQKGSESRVLGGGSFNVLADYLRAAYRYVYRPDGRWDADGFRVARTYP